MLKTRNSIEGEVASGLTGARPLIDGVDPAGLLQARESRLRISTTELNIRGESAPAARWAATRR